MGTLRGNITKLKLVAAGLLGVISFVGLGHGASAHFVYENADLYRTSADDCVAGRSEISHGTGAGYSKSDLYSYWGAGNGFNCSSNGQVFYRPIGWLTVRQTLLVHLTPGWAYCRDTGWLVSTTSNWTMGIAQTFSSNCGAGWYQTQSGLDEYNGGWKGGNMVSGMHQFF